MLERLPLKVMKLYNTRLLAHDLYINRLYECLRQIDEILTDYEEHDLADTIGYWHYTKEWKIVLHAFHKALKLLPDNVVTES